MNEPTEREKQIAREAADSLDQNQLLIPYSRARPYEETKRLAMLTVLRAIQDAKEQQNEDTARLRPSVCSACPVDVGQCPHCGTVWERRGEARIGHKTVVHNFLAAARGVQPDAGEEHKKPCSIAFCKICEADARTRERTAPAPAADTSKCDCHPRQKIDADGCSICRPDLWKPKTAADTSAAGEWRVIKYRGEWCIEIDGKPLDGLFDIADAHNASLAALRGQLKS